MGIDDVVAVSISARPRNFLHIDTRQKKLYDDGNVTENISGNVFNRIGEINRPKQPKGALG